VVEGSTAGVEIFNNTFHGKSGIKFSRISGPVYNFPNVSFVTVRNNHFITDGPSVVFNKVTTQTSSDNIVMTNANATQAGYVATGNTPFAPPAGGVTVGVGKDLTSLAAGIPSTEISDAATAALSDTSMGVAYDTVRHNVIGPNRSPQLRGTTWDIGAYQGEHQSIAPPQKLRVIP